MDAIQRLRAKAQSNNKLVTTKQQKVSVQTPGEQARSSSSSRPIPIRCTCCITSQRRSTARGLYADYPPYYFGYPSYIGAGVVAAGLAFGAGWAIGRWGNYWGGGCNWGNRNVYVNHRTTNIAGGWQHNSVHRGVRYDNINVRAALRRQHQHQGRRLEPDGFPRSRRTAGVAPQPDRPGSWW